MRISTEPVTNPSSIAGGVERRVARAQPRLQRSNLLQDAFLTQIAAAMSFSESIVWVPEPSGFVCNSSSESVTER